MAGLAMTSHAVGSLTGPDVAAATGTPTRAVSDQRLVAVGAGANVTGQVGHDPASTGAGIGALTGTDKDGHKSSQAAPPRPAAAAEVNSEQAYLDSAAAVAARAEREAAAPAFDQAMVGLSAAERAAGQGVRAGQALHEDNRLQQDQRSQGQAEEAAGIASEVARLEEEKRLAEEAAAKLAEQARLAEEARLAAEQAAAAAANGTLLEGTLVRVPTLAPVAGASVAAAVAPIVPGRYQIAARFGAVGTWSLYHTGVDLGAPIGTPIRAAAAGIVTAPVAGGWAGTHVIIEHADGSTLYAHMMATTVVPGQSVRAGEVIGFVGMTGRTFGPHLHFEYYPPGTSQVSPYAATDPVVWMARRGIQL
ncbi:M23 family metallopeptidase [Raineyella antarctica]|uniref:M23 family metallopeptidase n=1 Tax=Raineyella antarctica TaxID=1577474 RepID=UPI001FE0337C|nr:M23 family metallopeptidase [Raineyella antarctica]